MKIQISKEITVSDIKDKAIIFTKDKGGENKIFEIEGSALDIWHIISSEEMTMEKLHEKLAKTYETYTFKNQKETEAFIKDLKNYQIIL